MALKYLKIGTFQFLRGAIDGDVAVIYNNTGRDYIVHVYTLGSEPTSLCSGGETIIGIGTVGELTFGKKTWCHIDIVIQRTF